MKKAIVLTAFDRTEYIREVLDSWASVRGMGPWDFYISIDYSDKMNAVYQVIQEKLVETGMRVRILKMKENQGVLRHPVNVMEYLFEEEGYDFILRAEDDLVVSDDILEYYEKVISETSEKEEVLTIHGFSAEENGELDKFEVRRDFNPWIFGTWKTKWKTLYDNWDRDYSTNNGIPGQEAGFDWEFNRMYKRDYFLGIYPQVSRVKNIGAWGVHGTPDNLPSSPTFNLRNERVF